MKEIGLIGDAEDVDGLRPLSRNPNFRSGVILGLSVWPRRVVDRHQGVIALREERAQCARSTKRLVSRHGHDLTGVRMVRGDDDQRAGMAPGILKADPNRPIKGNRLARLAASNTTV
jgi:hypothetical protein